MNTDDKLFFLMISKMTFSGSYYFLLNLYHAEEKEMYQRTIQVSHMTN